MRVEEVQGEQFVQLARASSLPLPIEQSPVWDAYDAAVPARSFWRRLAIFQGDDPVAVISLTEYEGRGFRYLWAKHGPVWIADQSPDAELALRNALASYVRTHAPHITFVRMHARHRAPDLHELLQTVTYDRTVVIDLRPEPEEILASFAKRRRSRIRRALRDDHWDLTDESGLSREAFGELYGIYEETARRDDFGIYEADTYYAMIEALGEYARVFVARRTDSGTADAPAEPGRAVTWVIVTSYDGKAMSYYSGSNREARQLHAVPLLRWHVMQVLKSEGVLEYDLMGVDSDRAPQLKSVGDFKREFGDEVEVDGAWDVPVRLLRYRALKLALRLKRALGR